MIRFATLLVAAVMLSGCASLKDQFTNDVACTAPGQMLFTSWWFEWLGISAKVSAESAKHHCPPPLTLELVPTMRL